jgi:hypothetical protein
VNPDTAQGTNTFRAMLLDGQWTMHIPNSDGHCKDGTVVPNAVNAHYEWGRNTLAGVGSATMNVDACGRAAGSTVINNPRAVGGLPRRGLWYHPATTAALLRSYVSVVAQGSRAF